MLFECFQVPVPVVWKSFTVAYVTKATLTETGEPGRTGKNTYATIRRWLVIRVLFGWCNCSAHQWQLTSCNTCASPMAHYSGRLSSSNIIIIIIIIIISSSSSNSSSPGDDQSRRPRSSLTACRKEVILSLLLPQGSRDMIVLFKPSQESQGPSCHIIARPSYQRWAMGISRLVLNSGNRAHMWRLLRRRLWVA